MAGAPSSDEPARGARGAGVASVPRRGPRGWPAALVASAPVVGLAFAQGGYFATAWGWAALGSLWCTAIALVMRRTIRLGVLDRLSLAGLASLLAWILLSTTWSASPSESALEAQRVLVYLAALAALLAVCERRSAGWLLGGLLAAIVITCGCGLV